MSLIHVQRKSNHLHPLYKDYQSIHLFYCSLNTPQYIQLVIMSLNYPPKHKFNFFEPLLFYSFIYYSQQEFPITYIYFKVNSLKGVIYLLNYLPSCKFWYNHLRNKRFISIDIPSNTTVQLQNNSSSPQNQPRKGEIKMNNDDKNTS